MTNTKTVKLLRRMVFLRRLLAVGAVLVAACVLAFSMPVIGTAVFSTLAIIMISVNIFRKGFTPSRKKVAVFLAWLFALFAATDWFIVVFMLKVQ